ncbi:MAG: ribonuclease P protein component, partial [bacterium]
MIHRIKFNSKTFKIYSLKSTEIDEIFKNPRLLQKKFSIILPYFKVKLTVKIFVRDNEEFLIKYGIIASKKIGKAAKRNFLKRRIRQIFIEAF